MKPYKITKENVLAVKEYLKEHPNLTHTEIGKLCGVSGATVSRIKNNAYDFLITGEKQAVTTSIPYEELKRLIAFEAVVNDILNSCTLSEQDNTLVYLSFSYLNKILKAHIPDELESRLETLRMSNMIEKLREE